MYIATHLKKPYHRKFVPSPNFNTVLYKFNLTTSSVIKRLRHNYVYDFNGFIYECIPCVGFNELLTILRQVKQSKFTDNKSWNKVQSLFFPDCNRIRLDKGDYV